LTGTVYLFNIRKAAAPQTSNTCLAPGSTVPGTGC
jgi:hypothetical protein